MSRGGTLSLVEFIEAEDLPLQNLSECYSIQLFHPPNHRPSDSLYFSASLSVEFLNLKIFSLGSVCVCVCVCLCVCAPIALPSCW